MNSYASNPKEDTMKTTTFLSRFVTIFGFLIVLTVSGWGAVLDTDTFDTNKDGWGGTGESWDGTNDRLLINTQQTGSKTFTFATYPNAIVTVTLNATKTTTWESSDNIEITANGANVYNSNTAGSISFDATLNGSGQLTLVVTPNTNNGNEDMYIDDVSISYTPPPQIPPNMGNVPNQTTDEGVIFPSLFISTYVTLTNGDAVTAYTLTGALPGGLNFNTSTGVISGTPTQVGTFNLSVTATDNDGVSNSDSFSIIVNPGTPPIMGNIPNQNANIGSVFPSLFISTYVTLTNGDAVTAYTLTGALPSGFNFNTSTGVISGTPTQVGTFNLSVTATDNDGVSNSDSFSIIVGCNGSYDSSDAADSAPGTIITTMHGITTDTNTCINGSSPNDDSDYYYFTVGAGGILNITTSSPNSHNYHLEVGSSSGGGEYYPDTTAQSHAVPEITLSSGDSVYIYIKETGTDTDNYQINFDFVVIAPAPPVMGDVPNQTLGLGTPLTLSIASYVTEPNGDTVTYSLTGALPAGLNFNSSTGIISGIPTGLGIFNLSVTATDKDGTSNVDAFTITVTMPSEPNANNDYYQYSTQYCH